MPQCQNCDSHVTEQFARVFGDRDNNVFHCLDCVDQEAGGRNLLRKGAGAKENIDTIEIEY